MGVGDRNLSYISSVATHPFSAPLSLDKEPDLAQERGSGLGPERAQVPFCMTMATTCHMWHLRVSLMKFRIQFLGHESHILRAHRSLNGSEGTFSSLQKFPAKPAGVGFTKPPHAPYRRAPVILVCLSINGLRCNIGLY